MIQKKFGNIIIVLFIIYLLYVLPLLYIYYIIIILFGRVEENEEQKKAGNINGQQKVE